jgi:hypothetical protein
VAYTTPPKVQGILIDFDPSADFAPFIDAADAIVVAQLDPLVLADGVTPYYTTSQKELIERWLAAHFYSIYDPRSKTESVRGVGATVEDLKVDLRLNLTKYGQMAMSLDTSGSLAAYNNELGVVRKPLPVQGTAAVIYLGGPCGW